MPNDQDNVLAKVEPQCQLASRPLEEVLEFRRKVVQLMSTAMKEGVDYGIIPGCEKPSLWQPGAQKVNSMLQLRPVFERQPDSMLQLSPPFILHAYSCRLVHIHTGLEVSQGVGSCNSGEEKYGWRKMKRACPKCGKPTIIKGRQEYGGGWVCWQKAGKSDGCGAKFMDGDKSIEAQPEGKTPNENIWEQENTVRKQAAKRALIAADLNLGLSDIFTQDVEDMAEFGGNLDSQGPDDQPVHREKHEHFSTLCQTCLDLGVPEGERVMPLKNHLYLRSLGNDHGPEFGTLKFCPGCVDAERVVSEATEAPPESIQANSGPVGAVPGEFSGPEYRFLDDVGPQASPGQLSATVKRGDNKYKTFLLVAAWLKFHDGSTDHQDYYEVLLANGVHHANEIRDLRTGRKLVSQLTSKILKVDMIPIAELIAKAGRGERPPISSGLTAALPPQTGPAPGGAPGIPSPSAPPAGGILPPKADAGLFPVKKAAPPAPPPVDDWTLEMRRLMLAHPSAFLDKIAEWKLSKFEDIPDRERQGALEAMRTWLR